MKRLLHLLFFVFAFSVTANAQGKSNSTPAEKAKQNVLDVTYAMDTNGNDKFFADLNTIFLAKHTALAKEGISDAEKNEIYATVDRKLRALFSENQMKLISEQPELYERLLKR